LIVAWHGFIDSQRTTVHLKAIERTNRCIGSSVTHFDKAETAEFAGFPICDHGNGIHLTILRKQISNLLFGRPERQVPYINPLRHGGSSSWGRHPTALGMG
jgi:hypothetical protein